MTTSARVARLTAAAAEFVEPRWASELAAGLAGCDAFDIHFGSVLEMVRRRRYKLGMAVASNGVSPLTWALVNAFAEPRPASQQDCDEL